MLNINVLNVLNWLFRVHFANYISIFQNDRQELAEYHITSSVLIAISAVNFRNVYGSSLIQLAYMVEFVYHIDYANKTPRSYLLPSVWWK